MDLIRHCCAVAVLAFTGCVSASPVPLANSEPEGHDVYFYGDGAIGGKSLPPSGEARPKAKTTQKAKAEKKPEEKKPDEDGKKQDSEADVKAEKNGDAKEQAKAPIGDRAGTYEGTDTVTIRIDGLPKRVEEDPNAKLVVESGEVGKLVFKIIDSQNGGSLCSVTGTADGSKISFEAGQTCLNQILGVPMKATLESGSGSFDGDRLTLDYDIAVEMATPSGPTEGEIEYHFEGTRK